MITVSKGAVAITGTREDLIADLLVLFIGLIKEGHCLAITTALGVVLNEGGNVIHDQDN